MANADNARKNVLVQENFFWRVNGLVGPHIWKVRGAQQIRLSYRLCKWLYNFKSTAFTILGGVQKEGCPANSSPSVQSITLKPCSKEQVPEWLWMNSSNICSWRMRWGYYSWSAGVVDTGPWLSTGKSCQIQNGISRDRAGSRRWCLLFSRNYSPFGLCLCRIADNCMLHAIRHGCPEGKQLQKAWVPNHPRLGRRHLDGRKNQRG